MYSLPALTPTAAAPDVKRLRVLVANERQDRLVKVAELIAGLGHNVISPQIEVSEVGPVTAREQPDVAFVGLGESSEHALELIEQIVHEAACPVVALLHAPDSEFVIEAARRGIFAYITDRDPQDWQSSIEIVLRRFAEYRDLEVAFKRRTITERAKGILMERHGIDEERAFLMLRVRPAYAERARRHGPIDHRRDAANRRTRTSDGGRVSRRLTTARLRTVGRSSATACTSRRSR